MSAMSEAHELWERIYAAFKPHRMPTDPTPQAALNRIAAKCLKTEQRRSFDPSNCVVRQEVLSVDELRQLELFHNRPFPQRCDDPIIVLVCEERRVVIDGNNRVNKWVQAGASEPRLAIIIESPACS